MNFNFYGVSCFYCAFGGLRQYRLQGELIDGAQFARNSVVAKAIGTIRTDFSIDDRAVRAVFDAADVGAGESQSRGYFVGGAVTSTNSFSQL